jgi:hypothetical protein
MAHARRHDAGTWTLPAPLAEAEFGGEARRVLERQLAAGTPPEGLMQLARTALDSWAADRDEYPD